MDEDQRSRNISVGRSNPALLKSAGFNEYIMVKEKVRKLTITGPGRSYYIILPREIIKDLNWKKGEKKVVKQDGRKIIIEDWEP